MKQKEGQAWGIDLTFAAMIFVIGIVAFYLYALNYKSSEGVEIEEMRFEGGLVAESILTEGIPKDWNAATVTKIGLIDNGQINETKLAQFYNLTQIDYGRTKSLFGTRYNYFINLSSSLLIEGNPVAGIGKEPTQNAENTLRITRFTNYQNKPVTLEIITWKE